MALTWRSQERYLRMTLAQQFGIPILGELHFAVPAGSSTSLFEEWARNEMDIPAALIQAGPTAPRLAYDDCSANRNDVVLVFPGAYDIDTSIDWAKDRVHLIGMGGPQNQADYSEGNTVIYTDTTAIDYTIHLTGDHCIFKNIGISNAGANAGNFAPLYVNGYNNLFVNLGLIGNYTSQQLGDVDCSSLAIGTDAHNCRWVNCIIGEDCWGARATAYSGQVNFIGSQPNGGYFKNCSFRSQSATATVPMITVGNGAAGSTHIGRGWIWDSCIFNNWNATSTECNEVFYTNDGAGYWPQQLHNCSMYGYDEWSDNDVCIIRGTMPQANDGGGISIQLIDDEA